MDAIQLRELCTLTNSASKPCVSVYLPTHVSGEAGQEDRIRLRNLLDQAEEELAKAGLRAPEARKLVESARELTGDAEFWKNRSRGLALFLAPGISHAYRLPVEFEEHISVGERFFVKPLLGVVGGSERFFVLALSQKKIRLFRGSRYELVEEGAGLPAPMKEALNYTETDRGSQVHSGMKGAATKQAGVFHGQGGEPDYHKTDLETYFRQVDAALAPRLREEHAPLLLAGVNYLLPIYRRVNTYDHLASAQLDGNCDYLTPHEMHERAWPLMAPTFSKARQDTVIRYRQYVGTAKATTDIAQIVPASVQGRVETLFVDPQVQRWGDVDDCTGAISLHAPPEPGDTDLLELAAVQTLWNRGTVYSMPTHELPEARGVAAVLRY